MSEGQKFDQGKLQYDLIPFECLDELAKILTYGAVKYGKPSGWQYVEHMEDRYFAALLRHLSAYRQGEKRDAESGHLHLSHALCNIVFLLWKELQPACDLREALQIDNLRRMADDLMRTVPKPLCTTCGGQGEFHSTWCGVPKE